MWWTCVAFGINVNALVCFQCAAEMSQLKCFPFPLYWLRDGR